MKNNRNKDHNNILHNLKCLVLAAAVLLTTVFGAGCGKENKYVRVGVSMSTEGISLYLTSLAKGFKKVSDYVFFSESTEESLEKLRNDKQGIDIAYIPVKDLGLIKKEDNLTAVLPDCFNTDGSLKGVWVARNGWLENAPNYSYRFVRCYVYSMDYRASHMNMTYEEAYASVKNVKDIDWDVYDETMQFCAAYAVGNKETLKDEAFTVWDAEKTYACFKDFASGEGEGYRLCREAYEKSGTTKAFDELFDLTLALKAFEEVMKAE